MRLSKWHSSIRTFLRGGIFFLILTICQASPENLLAQGYDSTYVLSIKQKFAIPENVVTADHVGYWKKTVTWRSGNSISYQIRTNFNSAFLINATTGLITIADASKINGKIVRQDTLINLIIRTTDSGIGYEDDTCQIRVKEAKYCKFIDYNYTGTKTGTRTQPYSDLSSTTVTAGYGYFFKRGNTPANKKYHLNGVIATELNPTVFTAYGTGNNPNFSGSGLTAGSWLFYFLNTPVPSENCLIYNIDIKNYPAGAIRVASRSKRFGVYNSYYRDNCKTNYIEDLGDIYLFGSHADSLINWKHELINLESTGSWSPILKTDASGVYAYNIKSSTGNTLASKSYNFRFAISHYSQLSHFHFIGGNRSLQTRYPSVIINDGIITGSKEAGMFLVTNQLWGPDKLKINNVLFKGNDNGIYVYNTKINNTVIQNCRFESNKYDGIYFGNGGNNRTIQNCSFINNGSDGIEFVNGSQMNMSHNIFYNTFYGNKGKAINGAKSNCASNLKIYNNTIIGSVDLSGASSEIVRNNFYESITSPGTCSNNIVLSTISQSSYFKNPATKDYALKSTATNAINKGYTVGLSYDCLKVAISDLPDIGAYEFYINGTPPTLPAAPTALNAQSVSPTGASLNWTDNSSNENGFRLERKTGNGQFSQIAEVAANITTYNDAVLQSSTDYTYRIYAFNDVGNSTFSNEPLVQTPSGVPITNLAPGKPVLQSSTAYSGVSTRAIDNNTNGAWSAGSVTHTLDQLNPYWEIDLQSIYTISSIEIWNRTDACCRARLSNYYVFVSDVPFTSGDLNTTLSQSGVWNNFNAAYPNPSSTITVNRSGRYIRVQLSGQSVLHLAEVKIFGQQGSQPPPTQPSAPTTLNAQAVSSSGISLNWTDNTSNENGFRIERKTGSGKFSQIVQLTANSTSYNDAGLQPSTSYTYRVYAYNDDGSSSFSNESTVETLAEVTNINLAPGKPVTQSSISYSGVPERAIDNNTNGAWAGNSVIHTQSELNPYWQIDLQDNYTINNIEIWNRTDACCMARLANYYVFVSDVPFTSGDLNATMSQSGVWSSLNIAIPNPSTTIHVNRSGRYIRVQMANQGVLNMAEVKIFGVTSGTSTLKSLAVSTKQIAINSDSEMMENIDIRVYPNPSAGEVHIEFDLDSETKGSISVTNVLGSEQKLYVEKLFSPGNHIIKWNDSVIHGLKPASGLYVIKIVLNDQIILKKVFISSN